MYSYSYKRYEPGLEIVSKRHLRQRRWSPKATCGPPQGPPEGAGRVGPAPEGPRGAEKFWAFFAKRSLVYVKMGPFRRYDIEKHPPPKKNFAYRRKQKAAELFSASGEKSAANFFFPAASRREKPPPAARPPFFHKNLRQRRSACPISNYDSEGPALYLPISNL